MAVCAIDVKDLLHDRILLRMNENPYTRGLAENQRYPINDEQLQALTDIGLEHGGSSLYRILPGGNEFEVLIVPSRDAIDSYTQTTPEQTAWQRANRNPANTIDLDEVARGFHQMIGTNFAKLDKFVQSVLLSTKELAKKNKGNVEVYEAMAEIWTEIKADPDYKRKMTIMAQFLSEGHAYMDLKVGEMQSLFERFQNGDEIAYVEMNNIMNTIRLYERTLDDFHEFTSVGGKNPLTTLIREAVSNKKVINDLWLQASDRLAMNDLMETVTPKFEKAKAEFEEQIRKLEAQKVGAKPSRVIKIDRTIAQVKKDFERFAPSSDNVAAHLHGDAADADQVNKFILAGMMNPDLLVQGFMRTIKDRLQAAHRRFYEIGNEIGREFKKLTDSGFSTGNIDKAFQELYEEVTEYSYDSKTGEIEENNSLYFVGETSNKWRTEFTRMKAELTKQGNKIKEYREKQGTPDFNPGVFANMESEYDKAKNIYTQWRRDNFESDYDARYLAVDAILDTEVNLRGRVTSLREIRSGFYDKISDIQAQIEAISGVPTDAEIDEMNDLRKQFEEIKSVEGKIPGTEEHRVAELFTQYQAGMREMTDRWDISPSALDRFHFRKAQIDKKFDAEEITKEDRDRWYAANTTIVYSNDYWARRRVVVDQLNLISDELFRITGQRSEIDLKDSYERLESISRKYRDHNSHIDGQKLTGDEVDSTRAIEEAIESVKRDTKAAYSGFLGEEFAQYYGEVKEERDSIVREIARIKRDDPSNSDITKRQVAALKSQLKTLRGNESAFVAKFLTEKGMSAEDIGTFQRLYDTYRTAIKELSDLTESVETDAYYDTFQNELNIFVAGKTQAEIDAKVRSTNTVRIGKVRYAKDPQGNFREVGFDGELVDEITDPREIIDHLFRKEFEQSAWFKANHFEAERYDKSSGEMATKMVPIYSWRISKPRNPRYIREAAPNISWKRRVIKDEFKNTNKRTEADGLPNIKQGLHVNTEYEQRRRGNPDLWTFRDYMIDLYLGAQEHYPENLRMGMRVPSIERDQSLYDLAQNKQIKRGFGQFKRKFDVNAQDVDAGIYRTSDEAGYERKFIPTFFRGKLDAALVSKNVVETIGKYAGQAEIYAARVKLAQLGEALETTLSHENHAPSSESLSLAAKALGIFKRNKKRGSNQRLDTVHEMINMFVYGETVAHETEAGKRFYKIISNLLGMRASMIFSELPNVFKSLTSGTVNIGTTGWSQLVNLFGGEMQQVIKASIKSGTARFSLTDYVWSKKEYGKNSTSFLNDVGKITNKSYWTQFAEFFDANEMSYIDNFGEQLYSRGFLRQMSISNMSFFKNVVEHELFMTSIMAYARNKVVTKVDGTKIPLYQAFEVSGGQLHQKAGVELSDLDIAEMRGNIAALLRDINGNYGKLDRVLGENYWLGKTMFFMKKWLVPMVVARYGGKKYSMEQDKITQGYIRETAVLFGKGFADIFRGARNGELDLMGIGRILVPEMDKSLTDGQRDAIRRTRTELIMLSLMYLTYRMVLGYDPDDKERFQDLKKKNYYIQGLTYALVKATSEQSTFIPPWGFDEINKNRQNLLMNTSPFLTETIDILRKDFNYSGEGDFLERYKRDTDFNKKGDIKAISHIWKLVGLTNAKQDPVGALRSLESNLNK